MVDRLHQNINNTRKGFEESFEAGTFYNKQTQDEKHLELILNCLEVKDGMKILDLGTGTGYLAFPIAEKYIGSEVVGLDIVEKALVKNRQRAEADGLHNLQFVNYNGLAFPFEAEIFDMVITRYALHHFPDIKFTFQEVSRVLKPDGLFFLADPAPNDDDTDRFVDAYMQMKKDGHIKFYTKKEWKEIGESVGFDLVSCIETHIRFPKKRQDASALESILHRFDKEVAEGYELESIGDEIWIKERVNNLLFQKSAI